MKLISLKLDSFRQHTDSTVQFGQGLTGVVGANGAGKTSIVEAITFALYGSRALRGKIEDVRTRGKGGGKDFLASLMFEHDHTVYRVDRNRDGAELYCGGETKPLAAGTREVTTRVEAILGMSYDEFAATFFTEQKGLEFLSGMRGGAERERFIVRVMGYHRLELAQEKIRSDKRELKSELSGLELGLPDRTALELRLAEEKSELSRAGDDCEQANRALASAQEQLAAAKFEFDRVGGLRVEFERIEKEISSRKIRIEERDKRLTSIKSELAIDTDSTSSVKVNSDYAQICLQTEQALNASQDRLKEVNSLATELEQAWRDERTVLGSRAFNLREQIANLEQREAQFLGLAAEKACPTCGQELGASLQNVQSVISNQLTTARDQLGAVQFEESKLTESPKQLRDAAQEVKLLESRHQELQKQVAENTAAQAKYERSQSARAEASRFSTEKQELIAELKMLQEQQAALDYSSSDWGRIKGAFEAATKLLDVSRLQKVRFEGQLQTKKALVDRTTKDLGILDDKQNRLGKGRERLLMLEDADRMLTDFRKHVNGEIRPRLAELASLLLADLTDGRYCAVDIAPDFTPTVCDDYGPKPVISGGEQDILNLCVRLALSQMLAERAGHSLSLLILDEVFGSLDDSRRTNVLSLFEKLGNRFEQVIVISHLDDVKEGVQNIINVDYDEVGGAASVGAETGNSEEAANL